MVFAGVKQLESVGVGGKEYAELGRVVQQVFFVVDESSADLVLVRDVVVDALHIIRPTLPCCRNDRDIANLDISCQATTVCRGAERTASSHAASVIRDAGTPSRSNWHVLLKNSKVGCVEARVGTHCS